MRRSRFPLRALPQASAEHSKLVDCAEVCGPQQYVFFTNFVRPFYELAVEIYLVGSERWQEIPCNSMFDQRSGHAGCQQ
jgi:hypothetical protein